VEDDWIAADVLEDDYLANAPAMAAGAAAV